MRWDYCNESKRNTTDVLFAYHKDVGKLSYERWDLFQRHVKGNSSYINDKYFRSCLDNYFTTKFYSIKTYKIELDYNFIIRNQIKCSLDKQIVMILD